jgi:hypothetical protein
MQMFLERTEGRPGRAGQTQPSHVSKFVMMTRDGQEMEMLPPKPSNAPGGPTAPAISSEDALILQAVPVRSV